MEKGKNPKNNGKSVVKKERKSRSGMEGSPKKGGHGGKFTWSGDGFSNPEIGFQKEPIDVKDPNYEDPEDIVLVM